MNLRSSPTARWRVHTKPTLTQNAAYDEEDDGFVFTRKKAKIASSDSEPAPKPVPKRTNKRKPRDDEPVAKVKKVKGRRMSFSTPRADDDTIPASKRRKGARLSVERIENGNNSVNQNEVENADSDGINIVGAPRIGETNQSVPEPEAEVSRNATMISLPFSDTPIINRNKELRKKGGGARRSSLGLRGRRASSLIDNGHSAIPHREVEFSEFYKHIEADGLSEPRRMKQLLMWTGERAMGDKPSHGDPDSAAILAGEAIRVALACFYLTTIARVIKESLLKDFGNKSEFSDWFTRDEIAPTKVIRKPNPRNVEVEENLSGLEERIRR